MNLKKTISLLVVLLIALIFTVACSGLPSTEVALTPTIEQATPLSGEQPTEQVTHTPTPEPTPTPGPLAKLVDELASSTGKGRIIIFGLSGEDWANLIISVLIAVAGIYILTSAVFLVLRKVVSRTASQFDDRLLEAIGPQVRSFLVVLVVQFATDRLPFIAVSLRQFLSEVFYTLYILIIVRLLWKLLDISLDWYGEKRVGPKGDASVFLRILRNALRMLLLVVAFTIFMYHFGINVGALIAILTLGGLALSLAAQNTLADAISGFIILVDQPFRLGDRIEISELNTWGDVVEIGTRTTRIQTRDNRMVIVPNSKIGKSQIVNYSYPDPHYRLQVDFLVADGRDLEEIRQIMIDSVRGIEGVIEDKSVDALVQEIGDGSLRFRVRWWIDSYTDTRDIYDRVNTAVYYALKSSGIKLASESYDLNVNLNSELGLGPSSPEQKTVD
jgi:small-conductance mechanosensitive channel